jgi:pyridinium-3,5-biscarboxylic acid mononucleotide sulfurtransferase
MTHNIRAGRKTASTEGAMNHLKALITPYERVIVAFSGGVDSSFLLRMCVDVLGKDNVIAATGASETYTPAELEFAKNTAEEMNVRHLIIRTDEIGDEQFASNTRIRCYHCKKNFYSKLRETADAESICFIVDGTNSDDKNDYRPGRIAAAEYGILSPLMDAGITKDEIRLFSKSMNLKSWDRPANPCLASRVPYGSRITKEKLEMIARAEKFIRHMGFDTVRVRHHDTVARIEIPIRDMPRFMESSTREKTDRYIKSLGFTWIAMDMGGYRTGSMNEILDR